MKRSRAPLRIAAVALALARWGLRRRKAASPARILVVHHLLLGDTLMLTGLLAKLRTLHPRAEIVLTVPRAFAALYAGRPYGVVPVALDPRDVRTLGPLLRGGGFDWALLPADNRWSWLARAVGARWVVGFAHDRPAHKNLPVDEPVPYSTVPTAFVDTAAEMVAGAPPPRFRPADWPAPAATDAPRLAGAYAVLHIGASSPLKQWPASRWREVAAALRARGLAIVWTCGPGEDAALREIDPPASDVAFAGTLSLAALWHVLAGARALVCPDTGIAHLGRVVGVPTVTLFGPGSAFLCGPGEFFADMPSASVTVEPFPCRDQPIQFFRTVSWVRRCERLPGTGEGRCARAACMEAIAVSAVLAAVESLPVRWPDRPAA